MHFGRVSHKTDVYSYEMLVLEMVRGREKIGQSIEDTSDLYFPHSIYKKLKCDGDIGLHGIESKKDEKVARKMILVGLLYKKHHPPMLEDEVWRLEKIGKDGAFHKKLASMAINTVQDFLKLSVVDQTKLRKILGLGMSEKMWEVTIKHARTCLLGNKLYLSRGANHTIILNPICQVVKAEINGQTYPTRDSSTTMNRAYLESLVRDAYLNWNSLEEFDGFLNEIPLLTQGEVEEQYSSHHESMVRSCHQHSFLTDGSTVVATVPSNAHMECNDWLVNSTLYCSPLDTDTSGVRYHISDSSSDGDLTPTRSFIHHN
ncbi:unnamed protein product [Camellia sinensis]